MTKLRREVGAIVSEGFWVAQPFSKPALSEVGMGRDKKYATMGFSPEVHNLRWILLKTPKSR
jgi:hypothetical protein